MMKLPAGATGFDSPSGNTGTDLAPFSTACHQAARAIGGTVADVIPAGVTPNFHTVEIAQPGSHTAVLRHTTLPFVALAEPRLPGDATLTFIDRPHLAAVIQTGSDLQVLTTEQLHAPISTADLTGLGPHEHDQIAYWQPHTIGELLFNFWD
jgi:hypothetical protein